jgi:predicted DNA-binding transcriptional regulator YafY
MLASKTGTLKSINPSRSQRLAKLAALIDTGQSWSSQDLADQLQICKRTLFRDLSLLRDVHVPIKFDSIRGGYRVPEELPCGDSTLNADELVALVMAIKYLKPLPKGIEEPCERAIAKILAAASSNTRRRAMETLEQRQVDTPTTTKSTAHS